MHIKCIAILILLITVVKLSFGNNTVNCFPADTCHKIGVELFRQGSYIESIKFGKAAVNLRLKKKDDLLWKSYRNIGWAYYNMRLFNESIKYFIQSYETNGKKNAKDSINLLRVLGDCYFELGEFDSALAFSTKAINIQTMNNAKSLAFTLKAKTLSISNDRVQLKAAIQATKKAKKWSNEDSNYLLYSEIEKGNIQNKLKQFDNAIETYTLVFEQYIEIGDTANASKSLNNIATVYYNQKNYQKAIIKLIEALSLSKNYFATKFNYNYAAPHENLADNYTVLQQYDTALLHYQKALINLTNNFRNENIFKNPNPNDKDIFIYSNPDIIRVLHLKATTAHQYYHQNKEEKYLTLANQTYQTAFNFHDKLQKDISTENSRLFQAKNIVPYIENALKITYQQQENGFDISETAFRFMEKNKATVLLQSMNEADALQFANLPDSLLEQEKNLKIALTFYKQQLNEAIEYEDTTEIKRLENLLFEEDQKYLQLINELEQNHLTYYQLKYQQNKTKLSEVQHLLDDSTDVLEYFVGEDNIFTLLIKKNTTQLFQLKKPDNWETINENFQLSLNLKDTIQSKPLDRQFAKTAHQLYKWLIERPETFLNEDISTLLIIPDGNLNYIPFGTLLTKSDTSASPNFKTLPYLLKEKTIGYSYSGALWVEQCQQKKQDSNEINYAGFAPKYGKSFGQQNLLFAEQSIRENAQLFNGTAFVKEQATLDQFKQSAPKFNIVQLAMHVLLNDEKPMQTKLLFSQTKENLDFELAAANLYNMELAADLAILDACNTGSGQLQNGEGVMSLSRAFTYAGCASLVTSLWSIQDKSTATIVNQFLKNLKNGDSKHLALQQAKLQYINEAFAENVHPSHWAGLLVSGNQGALCKKTHSTWWALLTIPFLLLGMFYGRKI